MSRPRTRLAALATVTAVGVSLAACSDGGADGGALGSGDSVTIITSQAPWNPAYDAVIAAYEEETGIQVDVRAFPNDEVKTQMLNDAQSGNNAFDVYQVNEVDMAQFNANGLLLPLQDVEPEFELDPEIFTYDNLPYWNTETRAFSEDGTLTSIPLMGNLQIFIYRTDIYEDLGLEVPTTWDDVLENAEAVVDGDAARYGFVMRTQGVAGSPQITYDFSGILYGLEGSFFADPGADWTPTVDSPEGIEAATMLRDLAATGPEETQTVGQAEAIAAMLAGDAAQLDTVAAGANAMNDESSSNVVGDVAFAPLPGSASPTGTWNLGIPADLPEDRQGPALDFISWVTSEQGMEVFAENGGIPVRSDAFDAEGLGAEDSAYLEAVEQSAETAQGPMRYEFIGDFLNVTEPILANIAAGSLSPEEGMAQMQDELTAVIEDGEYPMG